MRKLLFFLCALLMMGATTLWAQSNPIALTFNHDTSQTEANAEVTVNVTGVEGVSATFQQLSDYAYANGSLVTNAILCPDVNRNATPTIQYEITLTGMPTDYTFNTYAMYVHAFASQGNSYQQSLGRTWDVSVQIDGEDFVSDPELDVCKDLVFKQTHTLRSETSKTTESGTMKLLLTIKGAAGVGCFFGLESITLSNVEATPEVPAIADGKYYLKNVATGQYLAAGSDWGTHAVVNGTGLDFALALADGKYTLDSNVSNGGDSHYLNGEYTDGAAFGWTFAEVGDAYTISDGTSYLTAGEDGVVTLTAETGAAAQWILETLEDRLATLATATADNGVDVTFLIQGANFGRNDGRNSAWTFEADNKNISGGNNINNCAESWHSTFSISQELTNVPAGKYELTAQGFWRQDGEDNDNLPYFFANDTKATFPALAGTENSMSDASVSFTNGLYTIDPITVIVAEDGTLTIGAKNEANLTIWCIWDNFRLTYYGEVEEPGDEIDLETAYNNALAAINDGSHYRVIVEQNGSKYYLKDDGYLTDNVDDATDFKFTSVGGDAYATGWNLGCAFTNPDLTNASTGDIVNDGHLHTNMSQNRNNWERQVFFLNNDGKFAVRATNSTGDTWGANTYWDVFEGSTLPEAGYSLEPAYVWQLEYRSEEAIEVDNALKTLKALIAQGNALADETGAARSAALNAIDVDAISTLEEAENAVAEVKAILFDYVAGLEGKNNGNITSIFITNPSPVNNLDGWEGTNIGGHDNGVAEYWNVSPAGFHQTVALPAGEYKLTAIAMTRTDMHGIIYVDEESVEIATVASSVVNSRAQAAAWFAEGNGVNEVSFSLKEAASVVIGLKADETTGDHWTVWQSFKLEKMIEKENALKELKAVIARGNALAIEQGDESIEALDAIDFDALKTLDDVDAAIVGAKMAIADYIAAIEASVVPEDITTGVLVNATPVDNLDGWEGTEIGGHDNGVAEYWNVSPAGFHQTITLPAGEYRLTAIALTRDGMHGTIYAGKNSVEIATVGSSVVNNRAQAASWFAAGNGVNELYFVLKEAADIEIGLKVDETTGDHWTVWQNFKIEVGSIDRMLAVSAYNSALVAAQTILDNESALDGGLFQKTLTAYNALNVAVLGWTLDTEAATNYQLEVAAEALNKAIEAYKTAPVNTPAENITYAFRNKASGLYLAVDNTKEEDLTNIGGQVYLSEEKQAFIWTAVEGGYTLSNEQGFVGRAGTTTWTMSASTGEPLVITASPVTIEGELYYTLNCVINGKMIGTDDVTEGSSCYFDKGVANNGYWTIEKAGSSQIGGSATAIEGIATEAEKNDVFDLTGRRVSKAQKGVYIINGKKVLK